MPAQIVVDTIRDRQLAEWTTVPVYYPNDVVVPAPDLTAFVLAEFPGGGGVRLTLDENGLHEETGAIRFVVHCRIKIGSTLAFGYADELAALFRSMRLILTASMMLETAAPIASAGLGSDGAYYMVSVAIPYRLLYVPS